MMFTALIMRPWILQMRRMEAKGRILADDILVKAEGDHHYATFEDAYDRTHKYLHSMGAKVAPAKSFVFSTDRKARGRLANKVWPELHATVPVVLHTRDLGSHLNTTKARRAVTLTRRLEEGALLARRIGRMPMSDEDKATVLRIKANPASFMAQKLAL